MGADPKDELAWIITRRAQGVQLGRIWPSLSPAARERAVLDAYDAIASRPELYLDMDLARGDAQLLSKHTILHARTAYADHADPARKRHLLRLWVSLDAPPRLRDRAARLRAVAPLLASLARARLSRAVRGRSPRRPNPWAR